jgi:hypothetical protein
MISFNKRIIENLLPQYLTDSLKEWKFRIESDIAIKQWVSLGKPVPPPSFFKNRVIRDMKKLYELNTFVETGTFLGNTTEIQRRKFQQVFSVELSVDLYNRAKKRFNKYKSVKILQGDSANVLPVILKEIKTPALFWLDAHYSGLLGGEMTARAIKDCPIYEEIDAIFNHNQQHVILVDDAREFVGQNGYPTLKELEKYIRRKNKNYSMDVHDDIIKITPKSDLL